MPVTMTQSGVCTSPDRDRNTLDAARPSSRAPVAGQDTNAPLLVLRKELRTALHELDGRPYFVIEDPVFGRFFRLGYDEWRFACQLDGNRTLQQAYQSICQSDASTTEKLPPDRIEPLCRWLIQNGLIRKDGSVTCDSGDGNAAKQTPLGPMALNPFFIKIPLLRPDRFLARLLPWTQWVMTWPFFLGWLLLCGIAARTVYNDLPRFVETARTYLAPETWIYLWLSWLILKVVHETAHGLVCKRYGGFVGDSGAALILFSPVAYVDVTSAWRFRSRWHRVYTSAAGIYVEFALAAVAAIIWGHTESVTVGYLCHAVIMAASFTTVLFNANPLMRFDGYYMLADSLNMQNLYVDGRRYVQALGSRLFLGQSLSLQLPGWRGCFVRCYGLAAACWRVLVCISMVIGAGALFHGAGMAIAAFGVFVWLIVPLMKLGKAVMGDSLEQVAKRRRLGVRLLLLVSLTTGIAFAPWPGGMRVPAVVAYESLENLRAKTTGFVEQVHVTPRQNVSSGTLLITLRNLDLQAELATVNTELRQSEVLAQTLNRQGEIGRYQAELEQTRALQQRRDHLQDQVTNLEVRAPIDGRVVDDDLETMVGMFVEVGTPLLRVASEDEKEIQIAIPEMFVESYIQQIGKAPRVVIRGENASSCLGTLLKVEPRATVALRHPALGAHNGGPLPVESSGDDESEQDGGEIRLVAPRFHGAIQLPIDQAQRLRDGQLAYVTIHDRHETVARRVVRGTTDWIRNKMILSGY